MTVALYPGSFDPVHNGHLAVIDVAAGLFERVVIAVGHNPAKPSGMFSGEERAELLRECTGRWSNVSVGLFTGLVTAAACEFGADCLVKGIRSSTDLDAEMLQAKMNAASGGGLPTVFVPGIGTNALVSSRYVREIAVRGGDIGDVVPPTVADRLSQRSTE